MRVYPRFAGSFALALIKSPPLKVWAAALRLANYPRNGRGLQHGPLKGLPGCQPQSGLDLLNLAPRWWVDLLCAAAFPQLHFSPPT